MTQQIRVVGKRTILEGTDGKVIGTDRASEFNEQELAVVERDGVVKTRCPCCMQRLLLMPVGTKPADLPGHARQWVCEED
jgi:hypothetical protein